MLARDRLDEALATLGALLEERGESIGVLVVGGGSLLLLELRRILALLGVEVSHVDL